MVRQLNEKEKGRLFRRYLDTEAGKERHAAHLAALAWARCSLGKETARVSALAYCVRERADYSVSVLEAEAFRPRGEPTPDTISADGPLEGLQRAITAFGNRQAGLLRVVQAAVDADPPPGLPHAGMLSAARRRMVGDVLGLEQAVAAYDELLSACDGRIAACVVLRSEDKAASWRAVRSRIAGIRRSAEEVSALARSDARSHYKRYYAQ